MLDKLKAMLYTLFRPSVLGKKSIKQVKDCKMLCNAKMGYGLKKAKKPQMPKPMGKKKKK